MDLKIIFLAIVFIVYSNAAPTVTDEDQQTLKSILETILQSDNKEFIIQELKREYVLNNENEVVADVQETENNYELLLKDLATNSVDTDDEICLPSGECLDPEDPGVHPQKTSEEPDAE